MDLHFEPVTAVNRLAVESLKLHRDQAGFIESVTDCLTEADADSRWQPVGIYDGQKLVGFAMYGRFDVPQSEAQVWLDRLLIDRDCQGNGYGSAAVAALLKRLLDEYTPQKVYLSVYDDNASAIRLYQKAGFYFNGELDTKGERVMVWERDR